MATVREGKKGVLLVVDVQVGVMKNAWQAPRILQNLVHLVTRARQAQVPVIWVQHDDPELPAGSPGWQWAPPLAPAPGETVIGKHFNSSFEQTTLDDELARLGASHLTLAGAASNWCIRATAHGALERGYDLTLVADAHTTESMLLDDGRRMEAAGIVEELNIAMTWIRYPGRNSDTATADRAPFMAAAAVAAAAAAASNG